MSDVECKHPWIIADGTCKSCGSAVEYPALRKHRTSENVICADCGGRGHVAIDCPKNNRPSNPYDVSNLRMVAETLNDQWNIAAIHVRGAIAEIERLTREFATLSTCYTAANAAFSEAMKDNERLRAAALEALGRPAGKDKV